MNVGKAAALLLAAAVGGCAGDINPVTGERIYTPISTTQEAYYGQKANDQMVADFGVYTDDTVLSAYVDRVGQGLAKYTVRKDVHYTFTILDDDQFNAFALPGGYVYITRGALSFVNSEAELAGILGHEIGHIDAFHFGRGGHHDSTKRLLSVLLKHSSTNPDDLATAQKMADETAKSDGYSQEQEYQADALGIHYMALAGYDPQAMLGAMRADGEKSKLDDGQMQGNAVAHDLMALDQSHPGTSDRETRALADMKTELAKLPAATPASGAASKTDRDAYLAAVDGMTFGTDPDEGTVVGHRLVNAVRGFSFEVPQDFDIWLNHGGAVGVGSKAVVVLESTDAYNGQSLVDYVRSSMMPRMSVDNVHPLEIDGYHAATGTVINEPFVVRLAALHDSGNHLYRLIYVAPRRAFTELDAGFLDSLKSFHPLQGAEAKPKPPLRLRVVTVKSGDTVQTLAEKMAMKDQKAAWFRVLNGMADGDEVKPGDKVKVVE
jgi:predicted Zn-dependent protease